MKEIEVSEPVYRVLEQLARPFEDTPDTVLSSIMTALGLLNCPDPRGRFSEIVTRLESIRVASSAQPGTGTPARSFRRPILEVVAMSDGPIRIRDAIQGARDRMVGQLTEHDYARLPTSDVPRWESNARSAIVQLRELTYVSQNAMKRLSVTDAGRTALETGESL